MRIWWGALTRSDSLMTARCGALRKTLFIHRAAFSQTAMKEIHQCKWNKFSLNWNNWYKWWQRNKLPAARLELNLHWKLQQSAGKRLHRRGKSWMAQPGRGTPCLRIFKAWWSLTSLQYNARKPLWKTLRGLEQCSKSHHHFNSKAVYLVRKQSKNSGYLVFA